MNPHRHRARVRLARLHDAECARWATAWTAHDALVWGRLPTATIEAIASHPDDDDDDDVPAAVVAESFGIDWPALAAWHDAAPWAVAAHPDDPPDLTRWPWLIPAPPSLPVGALAAALAVPVSPPYTGPHGRSLALVQLYLCAADAALSIASRRC